jgi:hypothetical protein
MWKTREVFGEEEEEGEDNERALGSSESRVEGSSETSGGGTREAMRESSPSSVAIASSVFCFFLSPSSSWLTSSGRLVPERNLKKRISLPRVQKKKKIG